MARVSRGPGARPVSGVASASAADPAAASPAASRHLHDRIGCLLASQLGLGTFPVTAHGSWDKLQAGHNELAHGTIHLRPVRGVAPRLGERDIDLEWVIWSRRSRQVQHLTMSGLRDDLHDAIGTFTSMLSYADKLVQLASRPVNLTDGRYIAPRRPRVTNSGGGAVAYAPVSPKCQCPPTGKASGAVNRSSCPDSVRHMSVTIVVQRRLLTDDDTR